MEKNKRYIRQGDTKDKLSAEKLVDVTQTKLHTLTDILLSSQQETITANCLAEICSIERANGSKEDEN